MRQRLKWTAGLFLGCLVLFSGCSATTADHAASGSSGDIAASDAAIPIVEAEEEIAMSGEIARDGSLSLEWDSDRLALLLRDQSGGTWGSLPQYQYETRELGGGAKRYVESHLVIDYIEPQSMIIKTVNSYSGAYEYGRVYSVLIENGIRITYYFDEIGIVIPVEYTLVDGALQASIDVKEIHEDINKLLKISLLPFCAAAPNNSQDYLFLPDGSGMLMYCDKEKGVKTFWSQVYGRDPVCVEDMKTKNTATARLPVFGVKRGDYALCGIITEGDGAADINAVTGEPDITYSNVYASFYVRGNDGVKIPDLYGKKLIINKYSDKMPDNQTMTVRYYPLSPKKQAYSEMADCYRNYLIKEKGLKKQQNDQLLYYDISMAADIRKFYFGLPFDITTAITDYRKAEEILSQTLADCNVNPVVRLYGIQQGGVEISKIGGGFRFEGALGNEKARKSLFEFAKEKKIALYPDFDIVRFQKSSGKFHSISAAKAPTTMTAYQYFYNIATKEQNTGIYRYMLLSPAKLSLAFDKTLTYLKKKGINAVSFSTLGNTAYSDYRDSKYYLRNGFPDVVRDIQISAKNSGISLMVEQANSYAAVGADHILSSPTKTSRFFGEGQAIPFYQMVFKGYVPMSTLAINLQESSESELLIAASTGIGLLYSICGSETLDYISSPYTALSAGEFSRIQPDVIQAVKRLQKIFDATKNARIVDYIAIDQGVYQTVFDNGAKVTVNSTRQTYTSGGVQIDPMDFYCEIGGEAE